MEHVRPVLLRAALAGLVSASLVGLPVVGAELAGLGAWQFPVLGLGAVAILVGAVAVLLVPFGRLRVGAARCVTFCAVLVLASFGLLVLSGSARDTAFAWLAQRSEPLVAAIKQFESAHGRPPESLEALVPSHLATVPGTEMPAYPSYEYEVFPPDGARTLHWYDLGSRDGQGFVGLWKYVEGEESHAILVMMTSRDGTIVEVDVDRMPAALEERSFDLARWVDHTGRMAMVRDLVATLRPVGRPLPSVAETLGPPSGSLVLVNADWELRVQCPLGMLNWDVFFYWPSEDYPERAYGGSVERIGRWAYVHE